MGIEFVIDARRFDAVVFDMDGVVTDTTGAHKAAWKQTFDEFLADRPGADSLPFDSVADYLTYVDGKPRYDGVRSFLDSRGIVLADGDPGDSGDRQTVCGLGNRKNDLFLEALRAEGARAYPSTVDLLDQLHSFGIRTALITSSSNASVVLAAAGLSNAFSVLIDGVATTELGILGKPAPDVFWAAADRLGVDPSRSVVIEDARSGVSAATAGGFGLVIGVARDDNVTELLAAGAHVVFEDLGVVGVGPKGSEHRVAGS